ncbi:hypothetical protein IHE45_09G043200, partial [Dioscorea alata]
SPFCGNVSNADTVLTNLIRGIRAPLCLIAQATLSSRGHRALNIKNAWLFSLLAFLAASNKFLYPFSSRR